MFTTPLDVDVPSWLQPTPDEDSAHFVTWSSGDGSRAVRVLHPVLVYPPGSTTTAPIPADYVGYLLGQADHGGHLTDRQDATVDGHPATLFTGTTDQSLDGSLGCPESGITANDCFGLQPEFVLRIAVITTDDGPLLIWLRNNVDANPDMKAEAQRFDQLLAGVHFSTRSPQAAPASTATAFDGVYQWTLTKDDALAHGTPNDKTPGSLATNPWTVTFTMASGKWALHVVDSDGAVEDYAGTFDAGRDHIDFHWAGNTLSFGVTADADGTLHLTAIPPMDPGDQYVWTTKPWIRQPAP